MNAGQTPVSAIRNPDSIELLPNSHRVYATGEISSDLRVPFREVRLRPTRRIDGSTERNDPVRMYDCSGPWGEPKFKGRVELGLPALRQSWILKRGDVEKA